MTSFMTSAPDSAPLAFIDSEYCLWYRVFVNRIWIKEIFSMTKKDTLKNTLTDYLTDLNVRASIAFGIALIAFLLTYIAFFK